MPLLIKYQCIARSRDNNMSVCHLLRARWLVANSTSNSISRVPNYTTTALPSWCGHRLVNVWKVAALMVDLVLAHLTHRKRVRVISILLWRIRDLGVLLPTESCRSIVAVGRERDVTWDEMWDRICWELWERWGFLLGLIGVWSQLRLLLDNDLSR